MLFTE
jgi:uncharacterized protein with beta-barrel porin domain